MNQFAKALITLAAALPLSAAAQIAQPQNSSGPATPSQTATPTNKSITQGAKDNAAEAGRAIKKSGSDIKAEVKKDTRAVKRKVAVAQCNDGEFSYTRTKTCSDHGGIKERLKKK